jgi:hypothetical protein
VKFIFVIIKIIFIHLNYNLDDKNFIDLLNKAQNYSLNDQRGKIDSTNLEIPNFLLSNNLLNDQNQSLSQSLYESNNSGYQNYSKINDQSAHTNKSLLLPITSSTSLNSLPIINYPSLSASTSKTINQNYMCSSRSRSPIVIVYDYEDFDGIPNSQSIYEENKNLSNSDASHSNIYVKHQTSSINQSYLSNNQYNLNSSLKTNRVISSNNSVRLNEIDEYNEQYVSSKQQMTSAPSLNNSQISYV